MLITNRLLPVNLHLLTPCAIALILGIWWQAFYFWQVAALVWLGAGILCVMHYHRYLPRLFIVASFFFLGSLLYFRQQHHFVAFQEYTQGQIFDVRGKVLEVQSVQKNRVRQMVKMSVTSMKQNGDGGWKDVAAVVQLYLYGFMRVQEDDVIELSHVPFRVAKKESFSSYLIKEGIDATLFLANPTYKVLESPSWSLWSSLAHKRQQIFASCRKKLSHDTFALFSVIFLGNKNVDKDYVDDQQSFFNMWGISHHLARSGLHLVLLLLLFQFLLRRIPLSFMFKQLLLLSIVGIYSVLSWVSISYLRALITFLFYAACNFLMVPIQLAHLVALVALLVLLFNPSQLFFLDFQLSFGITFALAWLSHVQKHRRVIDS